MERHSRTVVGKITLGHTGVRTGAAGTHGSGSESSAAFVCCTFLFCYQSQELQLEQRLSFHVLLNGVNTNCLTRILYTTDCTSVHTTVFSPTRLGAVPAPSSGTFRFTLNTLSPVVHHTLRRAALHLMVTLSLRFEFLAVQLFKST